MSRTIAATCPRCHTALTLFMDFVRRESRWVCQVCDGATMVCDGAPTYRRRDA